MDCVKSYNGTILPIGRTSSAQIRTASVRGEISASEEQSDVARAQSSKYSIHYHADEAVKAGNVAAVIDYRNHRTSNPQNHLSECGSIESMQNLSVLDSGNPLNKNISAHNGLLDRGNLVNRSTTNRRDDDSSPSKIRLPWNAMQSAAAACLSKKEITRFMRKEREDDRAVNGIIDLEEKILHMAQRILHESHLLSGAVLLDITTRVPDSNARARVKLIIEHPDKASEYIRLGLQNDPDIDISQMIRMIDYYCAE